MTEPVWPVADLDVLRRLRVIAAATPGARIGEVVIDDSPESVWTVAADLEYELPHWLFGDIRSVHITRTGEPDRLVAHVRGHSGLRARFNVVLKPRWCLMQSRFLVGGMAAVAENGATRFGLFAGLRGPLRPLSPVTRWIIDRALIRFAERMNIQA